MNRLNKTCEERKPDLHAEREERERQERLERRQLQEEEVCMGGEGEAQALLCVMLNMVSVNYHAAATRERSFREREERERIKVLN